MSIECALSPFVANLGEWQSKQYRSIGCGSVHPELCFPLSRIVICNRPDTRATDTGIPNWYTQKAFFKILIFLIGYSASRKAQVRNSGKQCSGRRKLPLEQLDWQSHPRGFPVKALPRQQCLQPWQGRPKDITSPEDASISPKTAFRLPDRHGKVHRNIHKYAISCTWFLLVHYSFVNCFDRKTVSF